MWFKKKKYTPTLVIHGGAGSVNRANYPPERQAAYRQALKGALNAGTEVLKGGGSALDAVEKAVMFMEDCPLFNCARGAVYNVEGKQELEASIMCSSPPPGSSGTIPVSRRGASITLLTHVKNPIALAKALYLDPVANPHFFLSGPDAERIAEEKGFELRNADYFYTETRWKEHLRGLGLDENIPYPGHDKNPFEDEKAYIDHEMVMEKGDPYSTIWDDLPKGTVGAVALDGKGDVACATSTGGKTNKNVGRIGDTPHCGSGFFASTWKRSSTSLLPDRLFGFMLRRGRGKRWRSVALSGTGDGDYFIRQNTCHEIEARMRLQNQSLRRAAEAVVAELKFMGGSGGVIGIDRKGRECFAINSTGMFRGVQKADGSKAKVAIFAEEEVTE
ncbi:N-terminal nucleophile aminohydrolase [Atractiella rhizophila]|nr:N-terminal nucleophile aminohydrolase [Atractiella rhizophila]